MSARRQGVSYSRFSDPKQAKGDSEDRQADMFRAFCLRHNLTPVHEIFADRGRSGYKDEHRKKGRLGQLVAMAKEGGRFEPGTVIVVEAWDRLGRLRPDKQTELVAELLRTGVSIGVCRLDDIFTEDDFGTHKWTTLAVFIQLAYQESKQKAERVADSWSGAGSGRGPPGAAHDPPAGVDGMRRRRGPPHPRTGRRGQTHLPAGGGRLRPHAHHQYACCRRRRAVRRGRRPRGAVPLSVQRQVVEALRRPHSERRPRRGPFPIQQIRRFARRRRWTASCRPPSRRRSSCWRGPARTSAATRTSSAGSAARAKAAMPTSSRGY